MQLPVKTGDRKFPCSLTMLPNPEKAQPNLPSLYYSAEATAGSLPSQKAESRKIRNIPRHFLLLCMDALHAWLWSDTRYLDDQAAVKLATAQSSILSMKR